MCLLSRITRPPARLPEAFRLVLLAIALLPASPAFAAQPVEATDARGRLLRLEQPARRMVTLAPNLTELAFAAGAGQRLAGVARYSDFPPEAKRLPVAGDALQLDLEGLFALRADLVLAWQGGTPPDAVARIERAGLPVFVVAAARLQDIAEGLTQIGRLAGTEAAASEARRSFEAAMSRLRARGVEGPVLRVFYEIWDRPLMTVSDRHLISEIIGLCGGVNVFGGQASLTPEVSREALIAARPDVVLGGTSADRPGDFAGRWAALPPPLNRWPARHVPADLIQRPTPRVLEGARRVCAELDAVRAGKR